MATESFERLWGSDLKTVAGTAASAPPDSDERTEAQAVLQARTAAAQQQAALQLRRLVTATIAVAVAAILLAAARPHDATRSPSTITRQARLLSSRRLIPGSGSRSATAGGAGGTTVPAPRWR